MVSKELIMRLRNATQAGMQDCSKALKDSDGDFEKAVDLIKVRKQNIVSNNASKLSTEGLIVNKSIGNKFVMVECNCQTDFVAKNDKFVDFANKVADFRLVDGTSKHLPMPTVSVANVEEQNLRNEISSTTGENCHFTRYVLVTAEENELVTEYNHNGNIGVIVKLEVEDPSKKNLVLQFAKDVAMQVAAMSPVGVSKDKIPADVLSRQTEIFKTQIAELKKNEVQAQKILEGKLEKWYTESCLLSQPSIMDQSVDFKTVAHMLSELESECNMKVKIVDFDRFKVGEAYESLKLSD